MSYHQKRTCSFCGARGRNVVFHPLMRKFYHRECWLTVRYNNMWGLNEVTGSRPASDYDENGSTCDSSDPSQREMF